ncbi:MAG: prolyl-tRNA synthetase associated domain-containing protein [Eubacterium sp.]|nr:prolyl-tRNA synthetase associated domain-containing protein [Eubacterium sp.]
MYVSEQITTPPIEFKSGLHKAVYDTLKELNIDFVRVDTGEAITMEDCIDISKVLECEVIKTLFLCNRQKTKFYLFVMPSDKPFVTKNFSKALEISRVSFAPSELLFDMMGTPVGATTVFSTLLDTDCNVSVIIDEAVLSNEYYGCTDGTTTGYMRVKTDDVLNKFLPYTNHNAEIISI